MKSLPGLLGPTALYWQAVSIQGLQPAGNVHKPDGKLLLSVRPTDPSCTASPLVGQYQIIQHGDSDTARGNVRELAQTSYYRILHDDGTATSQFNALTITPHMHRRGHLRSYHNLKKITIHELFIYSKWKSVKVRVNVSLSQNGLYSHILPSSNIVCSIDNIY